MSGMVEMGEDGCNDALHEQGVIVFGSMSGVCAAYSMAEGCKYRQNINCLLHLRDTYYNGVLC